MESVADSLKVTASEDDNLLPVRVQPGGNRRQRFLRRTDIYHTVLKEPKLKHCK